MNPLWLLRPNEWPQTHEEAQRFQRVVCYAVERIARLSLPDQIDDVLWESWRQELIDAGATDDDLRRVVILLSRLIVALTINQPELRSAALQGMCENLALTNLDVRISKNGAVSVTFPNDPSVH
jgi:hypothetical protein